MKCQYEACECRVQTAQAFCSAYCEHRGPALPEQCGCGHTDCR
jgi:hypothetical protein